MAAIWAGIDAGKTHHHCVAIDKSGHRPERNWPPGWCKRWRRK
ncbi:hypothetical protein [Streptomyces sp. NPDC048825]